MRPVGMDFLETAPRRWVVEAEVAAPRSAVWEVYVDPTTWSEWFPGVRWARYRGDGTPGTGSVREARVGRHDFLEAMVAWDEGRRWAYSIVEASLPLAHAQLECTDFEDCPRGTRLRWTVAAEPRLLLWLSSPFFRRTLDSLFTRAARNLEARLGATRELA